MDMSTIELGKDLSLPRRIIAYAAVLTIYFYYCYNFSILSILGPMLTNDMGFSKTDLTFLFSVQSWGLLVGTLITGVCCNKYGKKNVLLALGMIYSTCTLVHIFWTSSYAMWVVGRFVGGCALGGVYGTSVGLIVDMFPANWRGRLTSIASSLFALAGVLLGWVAAAWLDTNWTVIMWSGIIPAWIGVVLVIFLVPADLELTRRRNEEALRTTSEKVSYRSMLKGKYLMIGLLCMVMSGMNFSGYSGFSTFVPMYLQNDLGMLAASWAKLVAIENFGHFVGYLAFGWIGDRYGRKKNIAGMFLCAVMIPAYMALKVDNNTLFVIVSFLFGFGNGYGGIWGAYYTELFPERFRAISAGFCLNMGRLISSFAVLALGKYADSGVSLRSVMVIPAVFFLIGVVVWMSLPETLNRGNVDLNKKNNGKQEAAA